MLINRPQQPRSDSPVCLYWSGIYFNGLNREQVSDIEKVSTRVDTAQSRHRK